MKIKGLTRKVTAQITFFLNWYAWKSWSYPHRTPGFPNSNPQSDLRTTSCRHSHWLTWPKIGVTSGNSTTSCKVNEGQNRGPTTDNSLPITFDSQFLQKLEKIHIILLIPLVESMRLVYLLIYHPKSTIHVVKYAKVPWILWGMKFPPLLYCAAPEGVGGDFGDGLLWRGLPVLWQ